MKQDKCKILRITCCFIPPCNATLVCPYMIGCWNISEEITGETLQGNTNELGKLKHDVSPTFPHPWEVGLKYRWIKKVDKKEMHHLTVNAGGKYSMFFFRMVTYLVNPVSVQNVVYVSVKSAGTCSNFSVLQQKTCLMLPIGQENSCDFSMLLQFLHEPHDTLCSQYVKKCQMFMNEMFGRRWHFLVTVYICDRLFHVWS